MHKSPFLQEAQARGFIFQTTDLEGLDDILLKGPISAYIGFDPTADSLHVGSLVQLMLLRLLQKHGHQVIAMVGGGTAQIGDPSFREEARSLMTQEVIDHNLEGIAQNIRQVVNFQQGGKDAIMIDNAEWLKKLSYIELLRDVGIHFSVNRMLSFDSVKSRLDREQGLSFLEFNYSILQSYDFRELNKRYGTILQMGGSDQWGNIVSGVELVRRMEGKQVFGLTAPLLTTSSGAKMGKTAKGAVWLNAEKCPVFDFWQFWRNTEDADVGKFLKLFTDLPVKECERLAALPGAEINEAKKILATEVTTICHSKEAAEQAQKAAQETFEQGKLVQVGLPEVTLSNQELKDGIPVFKIFASSGLVASNAEARRLIRGGGAKINDEKIDDEGLMITTDHLKNDVIKLSSGRKNHILVKFE
ncbi:tyrosine--tRNA ligase [Commensalibacter papalotli (ex Botero et al. 2024)]|uniref:Tyrosine--tRNA ligase n=1 Tax=Commensalibacter papalotli (ex Botero et al. 2024) TaxID=2972766 RepID=A0ABM9HLN2_9PROT|nr:tyrosine--tRNA ligase [Commensalibacter papalotli (ex Botero et al. 2024)]CAI3934623.1 Tyrosyl-tRNA synthetase (TyrS) (PDB:4OUD) [Commensalibacter papalotli (ex Botero et al. 2024)]CAI3950727.1 Tyrosyl-tRNA synthetase (TyrS) (PDB:4OUD) [Commensalibacter papalotli (ex Botero et al. 2024)]